MAQQTWTQAFFGMVRFFIWGYAILIAGILWPMKIWMATGVHGALAILLGIVLGLSGGFVFLPRHTKLVAAFACELWRHYLEIREERRTESQT